MYNAKAKSPIIVNGIVLFDNVFLSSIMNNDTDASGIAPTKYYALSKFSIFDIVICQKIVLYKMSQPNNNLQ